ncbi:PDPFL protein, partial [Rissa tridactyla]|nr:PDPFL protein [Chroicocephalus maculipennis]NXV28533.1 PDPFL protein [Rissa tridactyla]NXX07079.1 PDPFL protein [Larus smithsonianus]
MASVPSAGCLLAKNQYYRSKCSGWGSRSCPGLLLPHRRLPELIDKCWWIKNFFHSEPSPPTVGRKTLSAS